MFKTPRFWTQTYGISQMLRPLAWLYTHASHWRESRIVPEKVNVPVICVGNLVMGGAGKTPTVITIVEFLKTMGHTPHILSRGYGGYLKHTVLVNPDKHSYLQVGDEPLLLAQIAPTWIGASRVATAKAAINKGATILVMDDGLQNPSLYKDFSLMVVDAIQGFGNSLVFPAGPLREPIQRGLKRAQAIVLIGHNQNFRQKLENQFTAKLTCGEPTVTSKPVVAFAGIGYPEKFKYTLEHYKYTIKDFITFADHYPYTIPDMQKLLKIAESHKAELITTAKDQLRLPQEYRNQVCVLPVRLQFDQEQALQALLLERFPLL